MTVSWGRGCGESIHDRAVFPDSQPLSFDVPEGNGKISVVLAECRGPVLV